MKNKTKKQIKLNVKKTKNMTSKQEDDLFNCNWKDLNLLISHVNDVLQERSIRFESRIESHCETFGSLFGINEDELMFYIEKRIKGPWIKIEKYLDNARLQKYKLFLIQNGFEERVI